MGPAVRRRRCLPHRRSRARMLFSPGHTPASVTYVVGDAAFIHDTLFMPDFGTARCDFPGGDAHALWRTIERILALPDHTRLFTGHDYMPNGRPPAWESTVAHQRARNIHLAQAHGEAEFVAPSPRTRRKFADAKAHSARSAGQYRSRTPASRRRQRRTLFEDTAQRACDLSRMSAVSPPNKAP